MSARTRTGGIPAPRLDVVRFRLGCGALLIVSPRAGAPITAVQVHLRGGHSLDPEGLDGTAWLAGRLVDQGTRARTADELVDELEPLGGALHGDSTGVSGQIPSRSWRLLCQRIAEAVVEPAYPRARFELQRRRLLDRLRIEAEDPRAQVMHRFRRLVYGKHWLGRSPHGTAASVATVERRHVTAFHRKQWVAARAVVAVCGDVEPEQVRALFDRALAGWRTGRDLPPPDRRFPAIARRVAAHRAARKQVHLVFGHLGVTIQDPDYAALVVMDHVLGSGPGFTNRIARRLRDEQGLAYSVHAAIHSSAGNLPGAFSAYIGTSPEHALRAVRGFREEVHRIQDEPVPVAELDVAKSYLIGSFALGFERSSRRAGFLVSQERFGLAEDHLERLPERFAAVTADDLRAAAQRHLFPDAACLASGGPLTRRDLLAALAQEASPEVGP